MSIFLSICLPTYNRKDQAIRQLEFISREDWQRENIEILIRDNASDRENYLEVYEKANTLGFSNINRNENNLGLVGNLYSLLNDAKGEYVWFVGDDDILYKGIAKPVINSLVANRPNFLMINHRGVSQAGEIMMENALPRHLQKFDILDVFKYSGTTMMFISACIYNRELLLEISKKDTKDKNRLTVPLYWSLSAASTKKDLYIKQVLIDNVWDNTSWKEESRYVFRNLVPKEIIYSFKFGFKKIKLFNVFMHYCLGIYLPKNPLLYFKRYFEK